MELDNFKSAWQDDDVLLPIIEEKNMSQITQLIEGNVSSAMSIQRKRYFRSMLRMLVVPLLAFGLFYSMSDGFTDSADSISTPMIIAALFLPLFVFYWFRYRSVNSQSTATTSTIRNQLPKTIQLLQKNQQVEASLAMLFVLLALGGVIVGFVTNTVAIAPMVAALILAAAIAWNSWRKYQTQSAELKSYLDQLSEIA